MIVNEDDDDAQDIDFEMHNSFSISNEYEESVEFLRSLAAMAPTNNVKELLFSLVDEIADEVLPSFKVAEAHFLEKADWDFDYGRGDVGVIQCKSWWKKLKKWCREALEMLRIVNEGYKQVKGIKDTHDDWNQKQKYTDPHNRIR